jgi:hypothetical protein
LAISPALIPIPGGRGSPRSPIRSRRPSWPEPGGVDLLIGDDWEETRARVKTSPWRARLC